MVTLFNLIKVFLIIFLSTVCYGQEHIHTHSKGVYTIIAHRKIRPYSNYYVSVSVHHVDSPVTVKTIISGLDNSTKSFNEIVQSTTINPDETRIISFGIGPWGIGNYELHVHGSGGLTFTNKTKLEYEKKSFSVFIQSDKAIYKPGQKVMFRAIIVRSSLTIAKTTPATIYIEDGESNRIKQWDRVSSYDGVLSFDFQLSDNPVLGDWKINIEIDGQTFSKIFTVAEYILPTFNVEVNLPSYVTYNKSNLVANIKATYTYGKPVTGEVTLTVQPRTRYGSVSFRPLDQYQVKTKLDGSVDIPVDVVRDVKLKKDFYDREIEFFALVEEDLTGRKYNKTAILKIYEKEINIELIRTTSHYKPGLTSTFLLKVAYRDDTPIENNGPPVKIMYGYGYNEDEYNNTIEQVPINGIVSFKITPVNNTKAYIGMRAEYKGQLYYLSGIEMSYSPSANFIQVTIPNGFEPKIDSQLPLEITATEPFSRAVILVISKGEIVFSQSFYFSPSIQHKIDIPVTHSMAPKARLIVYYVRESDQEIVADSIYFDVDGIFRTKVDIETSTTKAKPGEQVNIQVKTNPNAYVGVLGLDQSVLLLKSGNDVSREDVIKELATYDSSGNGYYYDEFYRRKRSLFYSQSHAAANIFRSAGVVILSNGIVFAYFPPLVFYRSSAPNGFADAEVGASLAPMATSVPSKSLGSSSLKVKIRKYFPETWLWANQTSGSDGLATFASKIPDTITTWIVSAFSVDKQTGLGIAEKPAKITVFRQFFVKLNLPYSIIRGETVAIQVLVFNYFTKPKEAQVTLYNDNKEFNFTVATNEIDEQINDARRSKFVQVAAESAASVTFLITTNKVGTVNLKVTALADTAGDTVIKQLLVKPEGQTQYFNKAVLMDFRSDSSSTTNHIIPLWIPNNAIPGSKRLTVSVIGDILGTSLNNIDDLLKMPYGCGEQNMLNFVPNIVVLQYLKEAGRLTPEIQFKALNHMEQGYQRELTYKRSDGSFSAFGENDKNGSTWLTAFVLKSFYQARSHINIDPKVLEGSVNFLLSRQISDGSFTEAGELHYKPMQGGSAGNSGTLAAYVMIALMQDRTFKLQHPKIFERAEKFLIRQLREAQTAYATNIITYALHLMDSPAIDGALAKLISMMKHDRDISWWQDDTSEKINLSNKQSSNFFLPKSTDIEATAYGLLSLVLRDQIDQSLPVMKWLISRQNAQGGFSSTQDTVIALQALANIAGRVSSGTLALDIKFKFGNETEKQSSKSFQVRSRNAQVIQNYEISDVKGEPIPSQVAIEASGSGVGVIQVSWSYNLAVSAEEPAFYLNPLLGKASTDNFLQLNLCTYYKAGNSTNMAVMEVVLPSGYSADVDALQSIKSQGNGIKRVESHDGDTNVVIYFDRITRDELCLTVPAHRTQKVANNKPVPVILYDYYNRHEHARMMYEPKMTTTCSICSSSDCRCDGDSENAIKGANLEQGVSSANYLSFNFAVIFILQLVSLFAIW